MEDHFKTTIPQECSLKEEWPEYHLTTAPPSSQKSLELLTHPKGLRWGIWPLFFEKYISDTEPDLASAARIGTPPPRFIAWSRVRRRDIPKGWHQFSKRPAEIIGFADLSLNSDYHDAWAPTAKRYCKKWLTLVANNTYTITPITMEEFSAAYKKSFVYRNIGDQQLAYTERNCIQNTPYTELYGVRDAKGRVVAGISTLWSPSTKSTYYIAGFIQDEVSKDPLMIGLMDYWHREAATRGVRFVHLGLFWGPGKDKHWKGFSQFKKQFCTHLVELPPLLWRFMPGKLF